MASSFTVFEKLGDATLLMTEEELALFNNAVMLYGMHGVEVELPHPVDVYFALVRDDIDNSKEAREQGKRSAAARTAAAKAAAQARWTKRDEGSASDAQEPDASRNAYANASDGAYAPEHADASNQTNPNQTKPSQSKPESEGKRTRFRAPSVEEVQAYAEEYAAQKGLDPGGFDAEGFIDYYTSNGWKVGRNPMRDWKAAVRDWVRKDCKPKGGGGYAEYDR